MVMFVTFAVYKTYGVVLTTRIKNVGWDKLQMLYDTSAVNRSTDAGPEKLTHQYV